MQNRYAGDVGDFGKLGLLRQIAQSNLSIGVNWYLVPDEDHNNDGKHIGYLSNLKFSGCDDELRVLLEHLMIVGDCLDAMLNIPWKNHFSRLEISEGRNL